MTRLSLVLREFYIIMNRLVLYVCEVENEHYSTVSGRILECFIEITPDFLCPFMND